MQRLALVAMCVVACGRGAEQGDRAPRIDTVAPLASSGQTTDVGRRASGNPCSATGLWAVCSVVDRLDRAGLVPRLDSTARITEAPLTPRGTLVRVGNADLELYVYPDMASREREQRLLDRSQYVPFDAMQTMRPLPTLIASANLIAILHSRNDHLRERVSDAITAGAPQPPTPSRQ